MAFCCGSDIEAECQDDYMKLRVGFNGSFGGLLYSSGYSYDPDCVYINGTGRDYYEFYIQLNRCGTLGKNSRNDDANKNTAVNIYISLRSLLLKRFFLDLIMRKVL